MPRKSKTTQIQSTPAIWTDAQSADLIKIRKKHKTLAERAVNGKSKTACIKLFCLACVGGVYVDARDCQSKDCFLWPAAFGRGKKKE
jgi:hypothetical protein